MTTALLAALLARANERGLVLAREEALLEELHLDRPQLREVITEAAAAGQLDVLAPLPFLVARLPGSWPGRSSRTSKMTAKTAAPAARADSFQSSLSQSKLFVKESYRQQPADQEALLREILDTLGESDPALFRGALKRYSPEQIRTVLHRVVRNPGIRKSRTALFRYLLPRLKDERPSNH